MYRGKRISLVIPVYNEQRLIKPTLENVPDCIDKIYVIDDCSTDNTRNVVLECCKNNEKIELISHEKNVGPGGGIITGYLRSSADNYDITVAVGGDYQMPLEVVTDFLDPLIDKKADYAKGNRFLTYSYELKNMPKIRLFANSLISMLTKIASGYYKIFDAVDGYTAITKTAIDLVDWKKAWKGYGYPMNFLILLNIYGLKVIDIPRRAIYLPGERQSQIKGFNYFLKVSPMLLKCFFIRLIEKYILRDFHPLVFMYFMAIILLPCGFIVGLWIIYSKLTGGGVTGATAILSALMIITGFQSLFYAMLFDMKESE